MKPSMAKNRSERQATYLGRSAASRPSSPVTTAKRVACARKARPGPEALSCLGLCRMKRTTTGTGRARFPILVSVFPPSTCPEGKNKGTIQVLTKVKRNWTSLNSAELLTNVFFTPQIATHQYTHCLNFTRNYCNVELYLALYGAVPANAIPIHGSFGFKVNLNLWSTRPER